MPIADIAGGSISGVPRKNTIRPELEDQAQASASGIADSRLSDGRDGEYESAYR